MPLSSLTDRFFRYVKLDTQSDPFSDSQPSTAKQLVLSRLLLQELSSMGLTETELDENGYVYASIPSNTEKTVPVICYCAHVDTSPDCKASEVRPLLHENYSGEDIILPDDPEQVIRTSEHPYLLEKTGQDIITASGKTLLGADDKAGVAIIMELAAYLTSHPEIKHGKIRILFTPDEEIGRGVNKLDMKKLAADFGYTLDGPEAGSFEKKPFPADSMHFTFHGVSAHPGHAKDKLVNAVKMASAFINELPGDDFRRKPPKNVTALYIRFVWKAVRKKCRLILSYVISILPNCMRMKNILKTRRKIYCVYFLMGILNTR